MSERSEEEDIVKRLRECLPTVNDGPDHKTWCSVLGSDLREACAELERLRADATKSERRAIEFGDCLNRLILAMRAAVVAAYTESPADGMQWIANTLEGPGHLPSDEDVALGAQALFDKEVAEHEAFRAAHPGPKEQT